MSGRRRPQKHERVSQKSHIVKGDRVRVIRGNFREMEGGVLRVDQADGRVVVEGVNMRKRHQRPTQDNPDGGIITFEASIDLSNVMLIDPETGDPSRVRIRRDRDRAKERISVRSGNSIAKP